MATATEKKLEQPATENQKQLVEFVPFGTKDKISLSIEIVKRLIAVKTKSGKTCSDEDAFKFMLMCQARKLNPFEGDAFLIGYDGQSGPSFSLITAHQAFLKRAELHPEFDGMDSGTIVLRNGEAIDLVGDWHMPNDSILGGWATVYFKNRSHPMKKRLRLARFNKQYGIWRDDPAGMIVKCAEADALRSSFPTMLGGMFISEEVPVIETEIARPVFQDGAPAPDVEAEPEQVEHPPSSSTTPEPPKKKEPPPGLRKQSPPREAPSTEPKILTPHARLKAALMMGNCTPSEFVAIAIDEGWVTPEEGSFENIAEERILEFMKEGNWNYIMQAIDEHRAKAANPPSIVRTGELL
jgi:phage recombination protein Bet